MKKQVFSILLLLLCAVGYAQKHSKTSAFKSYKGLVMAGYQGWFNAPGDGAGRWWNHYVSHGKFEPGYTNIDIWPDVNEYKKTYLSPFKHADGTAAYLYSSYDSSSVETHFKWMQQYGVDGVFVQRFIGDVQRGRGRNHNDVVLGNALRYSEKYHRAISVMYDLSGMQAGGDSLVIKDWKHLIDSLKLTNRGNKQTWLYHNGKPLVAVWGVGFNDGRKYGLAEAERIINFLKSDPVYGGCAVLLGKEPEIYEYRIDKEVYKYNRFVNEHYQVGQASGLFAYIVENARAKNFLYNYRPVNIEKLARDLAGFLNEKVVSPRITELIRILKQEVHEKFYAVDYIEYGIIYLHGKLPDLIKEYLESKFRDLQEINYIIANSVILEGMNLPINNLYILNTRGLYGKELTNLIGRVNRLNTIFTPNTNNLDKLLPRVHFINSDEYNRKDGNMRGQIELLRSRTFKDKVENPILAEFDIDNLNIQKDQKESKTAAVELIQENESFLSRVPANEQERLKKYLIESGIAGFYGNLDELVVILLSRIAGARNDTGWNQLGVMEKIAELFIREIAIIKDIEFSRLRYPEAQRYYNFVITVSQRRTLKENINHMFTNFKKRVKLGQPVTYFGETYGEVEGPARLKESTAKTFINLAQKNDTELVNLAIVKIKMEEDFVSFKLNKFIIMLYDYELITLDDYNKYIYGTTDRNKIELTKIGLSVSLISRLETDDQLRYIYFDDFNNLKARPEFEAYKTSANDFYRFEIERFLN